MSEAYVDIHCHLLPGIDDGARDWDDALAMARAAVADGTRTIIATPHQLGTFGQNRGDDIRQLTVELNERLEGAGIPLHVLPGGEARLEPELVQKIVSGDVVTLGDRRRHVLVELPHDVYLPLDGLMEELAARRITVILAHPERNLGLAQRTNFLSPLVDAGCLLQITAGSLCGTHGGEAQEFAEWMIGEGLVHLVATDAHGPRTRRPLMGRAYERLCELADEQTAHDLCCRLPARVAAGRTVTIGRRSATRCRAHWFAWRASA